MDNSSSGSGGPFKQQQDNPQVPIDRPAGQSESDAGRTASYAGSAGWRPAEQFPQQPYYQPQPQPRPEPEPVPGLTFGMTPAGGFGDEPRTGGMLAASIMLMISGGVGVLIFLALLAFSKLSVVANILAVTGVGDAVIAVGLFKGSRTFKIWAILRAIGCIVLFGLISPLTNEIGASWPTILFQVGFGAGLIILLLGERTSGLRVGLGVGLVVLCFFSAVTGTVVMTVKNLSLGNSLHGFISEDRAFVDEKNGVRLDLPPGWLLLGKTNPMVTALRVNAVAYHPQSGSYAAILIDPTYGSSSDLGAYVDYLERSRLRASPSMTETSREPITFAGKEGIQFKTRSASGFASISAYSNVCGDSFNHYVLYGWCTGFLYDKSYQAFQELEKNFVITKTDEQRLDERGAALAGVMPYLSQDGARRLSVYLLSLHRRPEDQPVAGIQSMEAFVDLLPSSDQARFYSIFNQALSSLPRDQAKLCSADQQDMVGGIQLQHTEAVNFSTMMAQAFANLNADRRAQITQLSDKAIDLGMERYGK